MVEWKRFLGIVILWAFIGQPLYLAILQVQHYHSIKSLLKSHIPLEQQAIFTSKNLKTTFLWTKPEKEFIYKGIYYDVIRIETFLDRTKKYYCITDLQEQYLKQRLQNYLQDETSPLYTFFQWLKKITSLSVALPFFLSKPCDIFEISCVYIDFYLNPAYKVAEKPPQNT